MVCLGVEMFKRTLTVQDVGGKLVQTWGQQGRGMPSLGITPEMCLVEA